MLSLLGTSTGGWWMADRSVATATKVRLNDDSREFGERVRQLRERADITLFQLSERSGVSRAMLSKVERGEKSPTIGVAKRIAHALNTTLSFLTGTREERRTAMILPEKERPIFRDEETGFERHILSPVFAGSTTEVVYHHLPAKASTGPLPAYPAGTEKYVIVAQGEVVVKLTGTDYRLRKGDAFFFEADLEHAFENPTGRPSNYYLFISRCV